MNLNTGEKRKWIDRIQDHYRLVILNDETLSEVSNYRLNLLNLYILLSTLFIIIGLLVFSIIVYTPLKKVIPGYADISTTPEFLELKNKTDDLEKELISMNIYIEANKNRILGNPNNSTSSLLQEAYKPVTLDAIDTMNNILVSEDQKEREIRFFFPPLKGKVSSQYSENNAHFGVDILAPINTPIASIAGGTVISSEYNLETGNTISIQHANNTISSYKHNKVLLKAVGDYVKTGEAIAIIGNSGTSTDGPHLHFELWVNGQSVNPLEFIDFTN